MSRGILIGAPVVIRRPLMPYDGATGTVTGHTHREGRPAYAIRLDTPVNGVRDVVILARHVERLDLPGAAAAPENRP